MGIHARFSWLAYAPPNMSEPFSPRVEPVACLSDNYAYLVIAPRSEAGKVQALVVDPSEAAPVEAALERVGAELAGVLATHHHWDHIGGIEALAAKRPGIPVVCSEHDRDRIAGSTRFVNDQDSIELLGMSIRCIAVPGHTLGAVAFVIGDAVFTGDTLFVAGCGRLFEGTPAQMYSSLCERLAALPGETRVYCGHEYTLSNVAFARTVEPENEALRALEEKARTARDKGEPTVPSRMREELAYNPFMRVGEEALMARYASRDPVTVLAKVREGKNAFRG